MFGSSRQEGISYLFEAIKEAGVLVGLFFWMPRSSRGMTGVL
jgi:hypothetical protein